MAKPIRKESRRKAQRDERLPLSRENFIIIGVGAATIVAGYVALLENSVEGFLPLVVAPILLVLGYCFIVPLGIMYRKGLFKKRAPEQAEASSGS